MSEVWLYVVLSCLFVVVLLWPIFVIGNAIDDLMRTNRVRKDLVAALNNPQAASPLAWDGVRAIAEDHGVKLWAANRVLRGLDRDIVTGRNQTLAKHKQTIVACMTQYKITEPFDELPQDSRLLFDRVSQNLGQNLDSLYVLANHTKEILRHRDRKNVRQQWYTTGGFLTGLIGVVFGVWAFYNPYVPDQQGKNVSQAAHQVEPKQAQIPVAPSKDNQ